MSEIWWARSQWLIWFYLCFFPVVKFITVISNNLWLTNNLCTSFSTGVLYYIPHDTVTVIIYNCWLYWHKLQSAYLSFQHLTLSSDMYCGISVFILTPFLSDPFLHRSPFTTLITWIKKGPSVCVSVLILHVLVGPLGGDRVLMEKPWNPGFVSSLSGLSPLSFLQYKLLLGGTHLVPIHDSTGHMLPQSAESISESDANGKNTVGNELSLKSQKQLCTVRYNDIPATTSSGYLITSAVKSSELWVTDTC